MTHKKANRKGTERKERSPGQVVSAPGQISPGSEWTGLRMGALALSGLQAKARRDVSSWSLLWPWPCLCWGGGMSSRMVARVAWCCPVHPIVHSPGALLLAPLPLLRLGVQRVGLFMVGRCVRGTARWSASESEGSPAAGPLVGRSWGVSERLGVSGGTVETPGKLSLPPAYSFIPQMVCRAPGRGSGYSSEQAALGS